MVKEGGCYMQRAGHSTKYFTHLVRFKGSLPRTTLSVFSVICTSNYKFIYLFSNCHVWVTLLVRKENIYMHYDYIIRVIVQHTRSPGSSENPCVSAGFLQSSSEIR